MKKMEKRSRNTDEFSRKVIKEAGLEQAPDGLYQRIMQTVELIPIGPFIYKPLISKKAWIGIALFVAALLAVLIFVPWGEATYSQQLREQMQFNWKNPLSGITFSKTTFYAVLGMALFFLQIPLLKRLLDKRFKDQ
jgi:hypothetical protein